MIVKVTLGWNFVQNAVPSKSHIHSSIHPSVVVQQMDIRHIIGRISKRLCPLNHENKKKNNGN